MPWTDAFAPIEAINTEIVLRDTWGHTALQPRYWYKGYIVFTWAETGDLVAIRYDFPKSGGGGPWLLEAITDFIDKETSQKRKNSQGQVYRFDGRARVMKNGRFVFQGKVRKINT